MNKMFFETNHNVFINKYVLEHKQLTDDEKVLFIELNLNANNGITQTSLSDLRKTLKGKNPLTALEHLVKYGLIQAYYRTKNSIKIYIEDREDLLNGETNKRTKALCWP